MKLVRLSNVLQLRSGTSRNDHFANIILFPSISLREQLKESKSKNSGLKIVWIFLYLINMSFFYEGYL